MSAFPSTLLLASSYEPMGVISWKRAFTLLTLGKVEVLEEYEDEVRTVSLVFKVPAVVRLVRAFRRFRKTVKFSRANIYARDNFTCQYCGSERPMQELTFDHVIPRSRGGRTEWTNIVTACVPCNLQKGKRTPAEAGMRLKREPIQPKWVGAIVVRVSRKSIPDAWRDYLYWTSELRE